MQLYRIYLEKTAPDKAGPSVPEAGGGSLCWPLRENAGGLELLAAVAWRDTPEGAAGRFLAGRGLTGRVTETEEVPPGGVRALWERADEGVRPPWAALDGQLRLDDLRELAASGGAGWLPLDPSLSRQELAARCERELLPDLAAELERIFSRDTPVFLGHPVHYILEDDGLSDVNETAGLLLSALRRQGRLPGGPVLWLDPYRNYSARSLEFLYRMQQGSALMVRLAELTELERSFDEDWRFNLRRITELAQRYRDSVLTVFTLPASLREPMEHLRQRCGELAFVWLGRGAADRAQAEDYLRRQAAESGWGQAAGLEDLLAGIHAPCTRAELRQAFDRWRDGQLRMAVYPDYRDAVPAALAGGPGGSVPY